MRDKLFKHKKKSSKELERNLAKAAAEILVVCEGETEGDYIRCLREKWRIKKKIHVVDGSNHVCIKDFIEIPKKPPQIGSDKYGSSAVNVVDYAIAVAQKRKTPFKPYKQIFCLFDKDDPIKFAEACQKSRPIRGGEVFKITSVPCIEYWLLLHFEKTDAPLGTASNAVIKLKKHISDYSEDKKRIDSNRFKLLCENDGIGNAVKWAEQLCESSLQLDTDDPTTRMYELMNRIKSKK